MPEPGARGALRPGGAARPPAEHEGGAIVVDGGGGASHGAVAGAACSVTSTSVRQAVVAVPRGHCEVTRDTLSLLVTDLRGGAAGHAGPRSHGIGAGLVAAPGVAALVVGLPLLVAVVALRARHWYPVLDLAMTEFRVRDVFTRHTPLIGLPGRIGEYPNQGSHPGPLSFYLLAPTYRLLGQTSWSLEVGTVVVHLAADRDGVCGSAGAAPAGGAWPSSPRCWPSSSGATGRSSLTQPWNPYLPLVPWIVVLLAAWAVLCGDHLMLIPLVVVRHLCAQTHVPYLPLAVGLVALGLGTIVVRAVRGSGRRAPRTAAQRGLDGRPRGRAVAAARGRPADQPAGQLPPAHRPLRLAPGGGHRPRRRRRASPSSTSTSGPASAGSSSSTGRFVSPASTARGAIVLVIWAGRRGGGVARIGSPGAAGAPRRRRRRPAARAGVDGPDLRPAVVLPDAVGVGRDHAAGRGGALDRPWRGGSTAIRTAPTAWRPRGPRRRRRRGRRLAWRRPWRSPTPTRPRSASATRSGRWPARPTRPSSRRSAPPPARTAATWCGGATPPTSAAPASACSTSSSGAGWTWPPTSTSTSR